MDKRSIVAMVRFPAFAALVFLALIAVVWRGGIIVSNDGPSHAYEAFVENHYGEPPYQFERFVDLSDKMVTARGFHEVFAALEPTLGWELAYRVSHVVLVVLWAAAFLWLVRAASPAHAWPHRRWLVLLGCGAAPQFALWFGLMPFLAATATAIAALALWLPPQPGPARIVGLSVLLFIAAHCHVIVLLVVGVGLGVVTVTRDAEIRFRARELALLAVASAPGLWTVARVVEMASTVLSKAPERVVASLAERALFVFDRFVPGPWWRTVGALAIFVIGLAVAARTVTTARERRGEAALAAFALLLFAVTCALPEDLTGWQFAGMRLLPLAAACGWAIVPVERGRAGRVLLVAALSWGAASLVWTFDFHARLARSVAPALRGIGALPPRPTVWASVVIESGGVDDVAVRKRHEPLIRLAQLVAMERGGIAAFQQSGHPEMHAVLPRVGSSGKPASWWSDLARDSGPQRARQVRQILAYASRVPDLVFFGRPDDVAVALEAGFVPEFHEGGLLIGRFEGCRGTVRLVGAPPNDVTTIDTGWWPVRTADIGIRMAADLPTADVTLGCGDVWAAVHNDGNTPSLRCRAPPSEPARAVWQRGAPNEIVCDVTPP